MIPASATPQLAIVPQFFQCIDLMLPGEVRVPHVRTGAHLAIIVNKIVSGCSDESWSCRRRRGCIFTNRVAGNGPELRFTVGLQLSPCRPEGAHK